MSERKPHKHAEALRWLADAGKVQWLSSIGWIDLTADNTLRLFEAGEVKFRIKPESPQPQPRLLKRFALIGIDMHFAEDRAWPYTLVQPIAGHHAGPYLELTVENGRLINAEVITCMS